MGRLHCHVSGSSRRLDLLVYEPILQYQPRDWFCLENQDRRLQVRRDGRARPGNAEWNDHRLRYWGAAQGRPGPGDGWPLHGFLGWDQARWHLLDEPVAWVLLGHD